MDNRIEKYKDSTGNVLALVIKSEYSNDGITFFTQDNDNMQVAYMGHHTGHSIIPHYHNNIPRIINYTCETLIIRKGVLEVNLYENQVLIHTFSIKKNDVLTLFGGGHGFVVIEDVEMIEIKQGPFLGPKDKTRF